MTSNLPKLRHPADTAYTLSTSGKDREQWLKLLNALPASRRDIHHHPNYMSIYEETYNETAVLFVFHQDQDYCIYPFIIRRIEPASKSPCDLTSVYGYGGPISNRSEDLLSPKFLRDFQTALHQWMSANGFVSEFCLLNPLFSQHQQTLVGPAANPAYRKEVVVADLTLPAPEIWSRIEERQRKAAALARRKGVVIEHSDLSATSLADFQRRYLDTMEVVNSGEFWKFPDNYFSNCCSCLGSEHVSLFNACIDGKIIASFFHLHMYDTVYYHFSCSDLEYRKLNPTSLLMLDSLLWAKEQGYHNFHMGGGRTLGHDSLFTFKNSFCHNTLPLSSCTRIVNNETYDALCVSRGLDLSAENNFFPLYRRTN